jgi:hypothetical protein
MRYKVAPDPPEGRVLDEAREALPLVPGSVDDCCTRIRDRTPVPSRDAAREWLTFLQALGLAAETSRGYHRVREDRDTEARAEAFVENIFPVEELLSTLQQSQESMTAGEVFEAVRDDIPRWERERYADWEHEWREQVGRILDWAVVLELVESGDEGYVLIDD